MIDRSEGGRGRLVLVPEEGHTLTAEPAADSVRLAAVEAAPTWLDTPPRFAGRVDSGPGQAYVHLAFLLGIGGWATACPADRAGADGDEVRHVRPALGVIDCPDCRADAGPLVDVANREVATQQRRETAARELLADFLRWAGEEYPDGGATLAVYAGTTRLHAMRPDERDQAVTMWLEQARRYPGKD